MRTSGILFPVFSIPSRYGIGCFSKEAYDFVDFLAQAGQGCWQILPIGPTGYGNSPYQPLSAFAGNPYFISPDDLIKDGLLKREDVDGLFFGSDEEKVDYGALYENRFTMLKKACDAFLEKNGLSVQDLIADVARAYSAPVSTPSPVHSSTADGKAVMTASTADGKAAMTALTADGKAAITASTALQNLTGKMVDGAATKATLSGTAAPLKKQTDSGIRVKETAEKACSCDPWACENEADAFKAYIRKESAWLADYALFMALKNAFGGASWTSWEDELRTRKPEAMQNAFQEHAEEVIFYCFLQYEFDRQWHALRAYANKKLVRIIGDLPFYVSLDSADAWAHPEVFQMDKDLVPTVVAGCPPDAFSPTGQLWGNPIYDWKALKKVDYDWWVHRIERNYEFYDVIRIDHFHGFCDYYAVPWGAETAEHGTLEKGPGIDLFNVLKEKLGRLDMIAEDLGNVTEENVKLLEDTGFPGMKVLQFGFTSWDSVYLNHRHIRNCVVYTGTHDNTPTRAWVEEISDGERDFTRRYVNSMNTDYGAFTWDIIREAYRSVADLCIIPLQDYLCKGRESRLNTPGTADGNWQWRLRPNFLSNELASSIRGLVEVYSRVPKALDETV
ncbi:MAG: 4-alpha-glucanotransferase [Blautia sp.]|nr:4-alpha-glucanotransferase [Blautia sp.]